MKKGMSKFESKAFECEVLGEIYTSLEQKKDWYRLYDSETDSWRDPENLQDLEKIAIIDDIMKRIEKML